MARNHVFAWVVLLGFALTITRNTTGKGRYGEDSLVVVTLAVNATIFLAYVAHSGGDFMFARRIIPALPLLAMAFDRIVNHRVPPRARLALGVVLLPAALLSHPIFRWWGDGHRIGCIADESAFYPPTVVDLRRAQGAALQEAFHDIDATFMFEGGALHAGVLQ